MNVPALLAIMSLMPMEVDFHPCAEPADVSLDTLMRGGLEYHVAEVRGFLSTGVGTWLPGQPALSAVTTSILLPPDTRVDSLELSGLQWTPLPGEYRLYPRQRGLTGDTVFIPTDPAVYADDVYFPERPVSVTRDGSAMGFSVVTLTGIPLRYVPSEGTLEVLVSSEVTLHLAPSDRERAVPERESRWSAGMRRRGIAAMVSNPEDTTLYRQPPVTDISSSVSPLQITPEPSTSGDCVDMVIITSSELEGAFQQLADYRTSCGIVTVVRTLEWIGTHYSGGDVPEMIRNFLRDAHVEWGVQAALLGGDDGIVPVRQCNGWVYITYPFPTYQMPSDDYYGDIDGDWNAGGEFWSTGYQNGYLDLCVGRWPVDNQEDVETMLGKLMLYEMPQNRPVGFARRLLLMGSNDICGTAADDMMELRAQLDSSSAIPQYLDEPGELYFPHSLPAGDLCRVNALEEFDAGYGLILHADHSETHKLATAGKNTLGQYMWDSDFATMSNSGTPSILWTLGCGPGHFDGADCFAEMGLLHSDSSGLVAVIANARYGLFNQKVTYFVFMDALFNTGYCHDQFGFQPSDWPLSYLGEAHRISKNTDGISFVLLNMLGSPLLHVWRGEPARLQMEVAANPLVEGVPARIPVTVTDGSVPVEGATVCIWKRGQVFGVQTTDMDGEAVFDDVLVTDGSGDGGLRLTALKHRSISGAGGSTVASWVPCVTELEISPASVPVLSLNDYTVADGGDGRANPGETVQLLLSAGNSGGEAALDVSASLSVVSGGEFVASIPDADADFPDILPDSISEASSMMTVEIKKDVESYSLIELEVEFSCEGGSGAYQWRSPLYLTVSAEDYRLTVMDPRADNIGQESARVRIGDMVLANCGQGEGQDLRVTLDNIYPEEPFMADTVLLPSLAPGTAEDLEGELLLEVTPADPGSNWLAEGFPRCSFDVVVLSQGTETAVRSVDVSMVSSMQGTEPQPPLQSTVYENGQDFISLVWEHDSEPEAEGYYLYHDPGAERSRAYILPVPVKQATLQGLQPGTDYHIEITAIDPLGRESEPLLISASTSREMVEGSPLKLDGGAGGGAATADMDSDGMLELVLASSFGRLYMIEKDGSMTSLEPPPGYDYDRFLGCAVGDLDRDGTMEVVVTCQKDIEVEGQERVGILLFSRSGNVWNVSEIAQTPVNQQAASPAVAGTPVIFQADRGRTLEIALKTKGHFGTPPLLNVWRLDETTGDWVVYGPQFPVELLGYLYSAPTALDFDDDGLEELLVTEIGTGGSGTAVTVADFQPSGEVPICTLGLPELDTGGKTARVIGTLAAARQDGTFYFTGTATTTETSSAIKQLFAYTIQHDPVRFSFQWSTGWLPGSDFYGNVPGPSLGDIDGDSDLDLVYLLNGGVLVKEGFLMAWDLADGENTFCSLPIPFNPMIEEGGHYIRSQPVTGSTATQGNPSMAVFSCYSSLLCGHDPAQGGAMLSGFPSWSRDAGWSAPVLCDLDRDGIAEVFGSDYSGMATLYDLGTRYYTADGWHMYQFDHRRSGFYDYDQGRGGLDISVGRSCMVRQGRASDNSRPVLLAEVEISGTEEAVIRHRSGEPSDEEAATVEVAAMTSRGRAGSSEVRMVDGSHTVRIFLEEWCSPEDVTSVVADPENLYRELDESNNSNVPDPFQAPEPPRCRVPSPAGDIRILAFIPPFPDTAISVTVHSLDGRLVHSTGTVDLPPGEAELRLDTGTLPAGLYTVTVNGLGPETMVMKVVVLH